MPKPHRWRGTHLAALLSAHVLIAVLVIVGLIGVGAGLAHYRLGGPGHAQIALPDAAKKVAADQQSQDAAGNQQAAHSDLRAEPPASRSPQVLARDRAVAPAGQPLPPATIPLATVNTPGCRTLPVRNYSARTGSPSLLIVLHQTISPDAGWNGVLGNVKWFDSSAAQASSNYIVARTGGQCAYIVPEARKAWAQAGFNSVTPCSIEVTETGREGSYLVGAGRARVLSLVTGCARRWRIPLQHGIVSGCSVVRPGVVEHFDLKACGGGHVDDQPYHAEVNKLIADAARSANPGPTAAQRAAASKARQRKVWIAHRAALHAQYAAKCSARSSHATPACRSLRVRARSLDTLLNR